MENEQIQVSGGVFLWIGDLGSNIVSALIGVVLGALAVLVLSGCAVTQQRAVVGVERALEAGSEAWDDYVDERLAECEAKGLATEAERAACIEPTRKADEAVASGLTAAVAALRAYWIGIAVGQEPDEIAGHFEDIVDAVDDLPVEHFGGVLRGLR